jgi:hypothetical protein
MGLADGFKNLVDGLTGEKERQRQQAEQEAKRVVAAEQERKQAQTAAQEIEKKKELQLTQDRGNQRAPIEKIENLLKREIKQPEPQPEKPREQVAEQMQLQPAGLQRGPSMGGPGVVFVNPNVRQAAPQPQPEPQQQPQPERKAEPEQKRESMADRLERQVREKAVAEQDRRQNLSQEQRQAEDLLKKLEQSRVGELTRKHGRQF